MNEYIDREAAIRAVLIADCEDVSLNDVIKVTGEVAEAIKKVPAANVAPIVYCKDCYWWYTGKTTDGTVDLSHCTHGVSAGNGQYFYCAFGQRRDHDIGG